MDSWPMIEACMRLQTALEITREERNRDGLVDGRGEIWEGHRELIAEAQIEREYVPLQSEIHEKRVFDGGHHIDGTEPIIEPPHPVEEAWFE